ARVYRQLAEIGYLISGPGLDTLVASEEQWPKDWKPSARLKLSPEEFAARLTGSSAPEPLARRITQGNWHTDLITALLAGVFEEGERFPTARDLAGYLSIPKDGIGRIYRKMVQAGYLVAIVGWGTAVAGAEQWPEKRIDSATAKFTPAEFIVILNRISAPNTLVPRSERSDWHTVLVTALHRALLAG